MISMVHDPCANQTTRLSASRKVRKSHYCTGVDTRRAGTWARVVHGAQRVKNGHLRAVHAILPCWHGASGISL